MRNNQTSTQTSNTNAVGEVSLRLLLDLFSGPITAEFVAQKYDMSITSARRAIRTVRRVYDLTQAHAGSPYVQLTTAQRRNLREMMSGQDMDADEWLHRGGAPSWRDLCAEDPAALVTGLLKQAETEGYTFRPVDMKNAVYSALDNLWMDEHGAQTARKARMDEIETLMDLVADLDLE